MLCDYHVHTYYSDDSDYLMKDVVRDAVQLGIDELCFTDHVDYGVKYDVGDPVLLEDPSRRENVNYIKYSNEIKELNQFYGEKISIKTGMEFGIQKHTLSSFDKLYHAYDFDFIILSCHQIDDKEFWTQEFQLGKSQAEFNYQYYNEILEVIKNYKNYSVLGHLDLINRYDEFGIYPFENIREIVTEILKVVIQDGKGIEVNTSSRRYGLSDLTPSREILMLYKKLGGTILTIGSDSHENSHLATYIEETKQDLKQMGFEHYCTYEHMKPIYHLL